MSKAKKLIKLLKSERFQQVMSRLEKSNTKTPISPIIETPEDAHWGSDEIPASEEAPSIVDIEHQNYLDQEPQAHFLQRKLPHPHHAQKPWEAYELGMGNEQGRPLNEGKPMSPDDIIHNIQHGSWDPHRVVVRPSNKQDTWTMLKGHPNFKYAVKNTLSDLYNSMISGRSNVLDDERYKNKNIKDMNRDEVAMIANLPPRR